MPISFQPLESRRIPSALRLSTLAGWNQTAGDWQRLLDVQPGSVRVWEDAGEIRATCSHVDYGGVLGWIGMILVDPEYRGRGLGKAAFAEALRMGSGCPLVGLDATEMGAPIYRSFGFADATPMTRWKGAFPAAPMGSLPDYDWHVGWEEALIALDRLYSGVDRVALLRDLARTGQIHWIQEEGTPVAYAAVRAGREARHIGPIVACSERHASHLMDLLAIHLAGEMVVCDVPVGRAAPILSRLAWHPVRQLIRMTLPGQQACLCGEGVWAVAGFEWG